MANSEELRSFISDTAEEYGIPPELALAVAHTESSFNPNALGPATRRTGERAIGMMQLMPKTAQALGVDPSDPYDNIRGGIKLLRENLDAFGGDVVKAVAAYQAGAPAVRQAGGIVNASDGLSTNAQYVNKVLRKAQEYGFGESTLGKASGMIDSLRPAPAEDSDYLNPEDVMSGLSSFDAYLNAQRGSASPVSKDSNTVWSNVKRGANVAFQQAPQLFYGLSSFIAAGIENLAGEGGIATSAKNWSLGKYEEWGDKIHLNARENDEFLTAKAKAEAGDFGALVDWGAYGVGYAISQGAQMVLTGGIGSIVGKTALKGATEKFMANAVSKEASALAAAKLGQAAAPEAIAAMAASEAVTKAAVTNVASNLGQMAAIGASAYGMEGGEIGGDLVKANKGQVLTGDQLLRGLGATLLAGSMEFVGDKLGYDTILGKNKFGLGGMTGIGGRVARGAAGVATNAPAEFGTEFFQTGAENWGKGEESNILPWNQSDKAWKDAINSGALGAVGGTVHGVAGGVLSSPTKKVEPSPEITQADSVDSAIAASADALDQTSLDTARAAYDDLIGHHRQQLMDQNTAALLADSEFNPGEVQPAGSFSNRFPSEPPRALTYHPTAGQMVVFPDGSAMPKAEYEKLKAQKEQARLDGMVQDAPLSRMAERVQERFDDHDLNSLVESEKADKTLRLNAEIARLRSRKQTGDVPGAQAATEPSQGVSSQIQNSATVSAQSAENSANSPAMTELQQQYEAAKVAGDTATMRELAPQINAEKQRNTQAQAEKQKPAVAFSIGQTPANAEPILVKNGIVYQGNYALENYETGDPVTVPEGASHAQIRKAMEDAGQVPKGFKFFGEVKDSAPVVSPAAAEVAPVESEKQPETSGEFKGEKWSITPYRYAKNSVVMKVSRGDGYKGQIGRVVEALGGRYVNRANGYVMSEAKARKAIAMAEQGYDGNAFTGELEAPKAKHVSSGVFGEIFTGFENNPEGAIEKLLQEKRGEVADAFIHPELGGIAFVYGNEKMGLLHILKKRGREFLDRIPDLLRTGKVVSDENGLPRTYIVDANDPAHVAVVRLEWDKNQKTWLMTAYTDEDGKFAGGGKTANTPAAVASEVPANDGVVFSRESGTPNITNAQPVSKIEDFGDKIGGARKDVWTSFKDKLSEVSDDEVITQPLSKIWPEPDYQKMLDDGADSWAVAFIHAARDEIPRKPGVPWKQKRWAEQVKTLRSMAADVISGKASVDTVRGELAKASGLTKLASRIELYQLVGHGKSLAGISFAEHFYSLYKGKENVHLWAVEQDAKATAFSNWPKELATGATKEEALQAFKAKFDSLDIGATKKKEVSFDIYARKDNGFWIGKKLGRNPIWVAGPFSTVQEARAYRDARHEDLLSKLEKAKEIPNERRDTNNPRVGEDMRNGQDVTPQMFGEAFGFRGVEFGNWVEQKKRQKDLNDAFDALMDMAAILDVPPKALSLNGELGLAFGARGSGGIGAAAAHYEQGKIVINLTKKEGAGSLGHEWWHALDNYFNRMRGKGEYATEALDVSLASRGAEFAANTAMRKEMVEAFGAVVRAIKTTAIKARSSKLDAKRSKEYWTTGREMSARAFESYLISKLQDQNASNDYLANIVDDETWAAAEKLGFELDGSYPYPTAGEMPAIREGFDTLFQTMQHEETDKGVRLYSESRSTLPKQTDAAREITSPESAEVRKLLGKNLPKDGKVGVVSDISTLPTAKEALATDRMSRKTAEAIRFIAGMFGRKVVFYEATHNVPEGINQDGKTIYVNVDGGVDAIAVAGHEFTHSLKHTDPDAYKAAHDAVVALLRKDGRRAVMYRRYYGNKSMSLDSLADELLSDIGGNLWRDESFFVEMFAEVHRQHPHQEARSIISRLRDAIVAFLNKLIAATPKQGFNIEGQGFTREELQGIRDMVTRMAARSFIAEEKARASGEVAYRGNAQGDVKRSESRTEMPRLSPARLAEAWEQVAQDPSIFRYPKSDSKDIEEVFSKIAPEMRIEHHGQVLDYDDTWKVHTPTGGVGYVLIYPDGKVEVNTLHVGEGNNGSAIYAAVGNWAYNTGMVFDGDRLGIKDAGVERRIENLISLALKFRSTDFLGLGKELEERIGAKLIPGEFRRNLGILLQESYDHVAMNFPEIEDVRYNFDTGRFEPPIDDGMVKRAREAGVRGGKGTLARSAFSGTVLVSGGVHEGRGARDKQSIDTGRNELAGALYSTQRQTGQKVTDDATEQGGVSLSTARAQTDTPEFKKWFGDSKVVDAEGRPLVVYHGTKSDVSAFDPKAISQDEYGQGFYFTEFPNMANRYAHSDYGIGGNVIPAYVSLKNPAIVRGAFADGDLYQLAGANRRSELTTALTAKGYDGVIRYTRDGMAEIVAFSPTQIKSAIGNNGQFDSSNPDIRYSAKRDVSLDTHGAFWAKIKEGSNSFTVKEIEDAFAIGRRGNVRQGNLDIVAGKTLSAAEAARVTAEWDESIAGFESYISTGTVTEAEEGQSAFVVSFIPMDLWGRVNPDDLKSLDDAAVTQYAFVELPDGTFDLSVNDVKKGSKVESLLASNGRLEKNKSNPLYQNAILDKPYTETKALMQESARRLALWAGVVPHIVQSSRETGARAGDNTSRDYPPSVIERKFSTPRIIGASNRQYTPEQQKAFANTGRTVDEKTTLEKLKAFVSKRWQQGIFDQFAPFRSIDSKAYTLMRLSKGSTGAFEALMHHGKLSIRDGAFDADTSGGVMERLFYALGKESTDFLYWIAGNRAERLAKEGKENLFTPQDIAAYKSLASGQTDFDYTIQTGPGAGKVTRDRTLIYADSQRILNEFNKNVLDMAEESGLIDGASRHLWEHEFYVPFYRSMEDDEGSVRGANISKGLVRQEAFKKLKGGTEGLNDLLANTLMNWAHLIDASAKNRAAIASIKAAENIGVARPAVSGEKGTVWFMDGGKKAEYKISDPSVMEAIQGLEYAGLRGGVWDILTKPKHWLTVGVTASPFFKVRNLIRDSLQAIGTSDLRANPIANIAEGIKLTNRQRQEYVSALAGGGLIRFGTMIENNEAARVRQLIKKGAKDGHILDGETALRRFYDKWFEPAVAAYNELGNRGEEINRMALFDQLKKQGIDHATASLMARDLMDFSLQGSFTTIRVLAQILPFFNARLQGLYKLGRATKENQAQMATVIFASAVAGIALMGLAASDEDKWKKWKRREEWDKATYWFFEFGGMEFRIPKPFELGAVAHMAERTVEALFDDEKEAGSRWAKAMLDVAKNQLSMNPVPQAFKPIIDLYANKDSFTGRTIESLAMQKWNPTERYNARTSMPARWASEATLGALSPVQVDHLVQSYFGWLGGAAVGLADIVARGVNNEPTRPALDYWKFFTGGMVKEDETSSRYVSLMYDQAKELEQAYNTHRHLMKEGRMDEAKEFAEDNAEKLRAYRSVESIKKQETQISERIRMIERSDIHPAEKRIKIRELKQRQSEIAERLSQ